MKKKLVYFPKSGGANAYPLRMQKILASFSDVEGLNLKGTMQEILKFNFSKKDVLVLNWIESDIIGKTGRVSLTGISKILLKILIFKLKFKKIIFVRHNIYPHKANKENSNKATKLVDKLEGLFDHKVVHSPVYTKDGYEYIPHPLYTYPLVIDNKNLVECDNNKFIIFGRILEYKKFEVIIESFPAEQELLIVGHCEDYGYLDKIKALIREKKNITIFPSYLDDKEAKELINSTGGLIISHADEDMIVSGSFFYGLTIGVKMYAVSTPFLKWAEEQFGNDIIETFPDVVSLCKRIERRPIREHISNGTISDINSSFSDEAIASSFSRLCQK
ncbi:hypothetical protein ACSGEN_01555 [Klebsiella pneumoniae]|uniref:Glycosyltransferase n=2 Tax=Klebsiella pneumoniae complex TaxID=3390273 RepID=A0A193SD58_KLEPN|nr:hypothetical protein [Klebsiella pneumoniae]MCC4929273.1 hypothetical protein [Klebsiella pneumoniae]MDP1239177.1 hypothetical protein [Klebsiella pneumoniae]MDV1146439.1 hypothetical protein [Klebsiella pneumoniae]MDV1193813.1 hypothetical protein [Klebsiella pneumoniae]MDV1234472.1 hypothetical protein [Klebsiella pneumoniae]